MGNSTTEYHPIYTYGSPATKLSTYMGIASLAGAIIKAIKKNKWMIQEDGQSNPQAGLNLILTVLYTVQTLTLLIELHRIRPDLVIRWYGD